MDENLFLNELDEKVKEIEGLWDDRFIPYDIVQKMTKGYKLHKEYHYGKFKEVSVLWYKKGNSNLYIIRNNTTGVYKLITEDWKRAESLARQLANRYNALSSLFGW